MQRTGPLAVGPDRVVIVLREVPAQYIERHRRPLPVARPERARRLREPVDTLTLPVVDLPAQAVSHSQPLLVGEGRALLNEVPEQRHHVGVVVVRPLQWVVLVLDALAVDVGYLRLRLVVGEGQSQRLAGLELVACHVVHCHALADAVPAEVPSRPIPRRGLPDLELPQVGRHLDAVPELDLHQPPHRELALRPAGRVEHLDELVRRLGYSRVVTATDIDGVMPAAEWVVAGADDVAVGSRIAQVQQRIVAVVDLLHALARRPIPEHDEVPRDRHRGLRRRVQHDGRRDTGDALDGRLNRLRLVVIAA